MLRRRGILVVVLLTLLVLLGTVCAEGEEVWAVIIGISQYMDRSIPGLRFCDDDARELKMILQDKGGIPEDHIKFLINDEATREHIRMALEHWLNRKEEEGDIVIIYYSGHGIFGEDQNDDEKDGFDEYLVPYDYQPDILATAIADDRFADWIQALDCRRVVIIFDSCYSGGVAGPDKSIRLPASMKDGRQLTDDILTDISKPGTIVLAACKPAEKAQELTKLGHGIFTYFLLDALRGLGDEPIDGSKYRHGDCDGVVSAVEAFQYAEEAVRTYISEYDGPEPIKKQRPSMSNNLLNGTTIAMTRTGNPCFIKGKIIHVWGENELVSINVGKRHGVKEGYEFDVYVGPPTRAVGKIRIESDIYEDCSYAKVIESEINFNEGYEVVKKLKGRIPPSERKGKIVFTSNRDDGNMEIYVMDTDGSNQIRLTDNEADDWSPVWSPDGKKIAFTSNRDGNSEIYIMNADGSEPINLTNNFAGDEEPSWSPDGKKIAFTSNRDGNLEIYIMNADGSEPINLTESDDREFESAWFPDGSKISYTFYDGRNPTEIYGIDATGEGELNLTDSPFWEWRSAWSPDGKKIAYYRDAVYNICVMDRNGAEQNVLIYNLDYEDLLPSWSPDGTQIVFQSNRDGNYEIYVMDAGGTNQTRLTRADPAKLEGGLLVENKEPDWWASE